MKTSRQKMRLQWEVGVDQYGFHVTGWAGKDHWVIRSFPTLARAEFFMLGKDIAWALWRRRQWLRLKERHAAFLEALGGHHALSVTVEHVRSSTGAPRALSHATFYVPAQRTGIDTSSDHGRAL